MRVMVNQTTALGAKTGIGHYTFQLLRAMRELASEDFFGVFPSGWWSAFRGLSGYLRPRRRPAQNQPADPTWKTALSNRLRTLGDYALTHHLRLSNRWHKYDLYHEPNYIPLPSELPTVATVHDLSVLLHPEWHPADRVAYYERNFQDGMNRCQHLLAVSEFTRQEVIRGLNIAPDKITCTHLGVRPDLRPLEASVIAEAVRRLGLPGQYLLFVGTIEPRKNALMLMRAYCELPAGVRARCPLVLAGSWGWNAGAFVEYYEKEGRARGVVHLGYVPDQDLAAIYGAARALVFPSFYEGFGLPPLEMMACGGAVLASTAGSVVEVVGRKAHLLPADDFASWRDAMKRIIMDDDWHRTLRSGVCELAAAYSWESCARQTLRVYRSVVRLPIPKETPPRRLAG
jgi:glycosyltransferase involved in cell wall biosynthesis